MQQTVDCARELVNRFHANFVVDDINPQPVFDFPTPKAVGLAAIAYQHPEVLFFTGAGNNGGGYYEGRWTPVPLVVEGTAYLAQDFGQSLGGQSDPYETFLLPAGPQALVMLGTSANPEGQPSDCNADNPEVTLVLLDRQGDVLASVTGKCPIERLTFRRGRLAFRPHASPFPPHAPFGVRPQPLRLAVLLPQDSRHTDFTLKLTTVLVGHGVSPLALSYPTEGSAGNSATVKDLIAVAAVDPNSGWRDRYLYEPFSNSGPQCLDYVQNDSGGWTRLSGAQCTRQPAFVVPDRTVVLMPARPGDSRCWNGRPVLRPQDPDGSLITATA